MTVGQAVDAFRVSCPNSTLVAPYGPGGSVFAYAAACA